MTDATYAQLKPRKIFGDSCSRQQLLSSRTHKSSITKPFEGLMATYPVVGTMQLHTFVRNFTFSPNSQSINY